MGLICIALGGFVLESSGQSEYFVAGHVLISLAAICLALFTTAFIIISQLTRGVNTFLQYIVPHYWLCGVNYHHDMGLGTVSRQ
ncbi:FIG00638244: hypothetical protein [Escherichia coli ISC7]|nr:FIG00638244: hypothetical protein [Escherichia coli ISC7]